MSVHHLHALKAWTGKKMLPSFCSSNRLCAQNSYSPLHPSHKALSTPKHATVPHNRTASAQGNDDLRFVAQDQACLWLQANTITVQYEKYRRHLGVVENSSLPGHDVVSFDYWIQTFRNKVFLHSLGSRLIGEEKDIKVPSKRPEPLQQQQNKRNIIKLSTFMK